MSKVVLVTNIPSPYRVDLFYYMQTHLTEHEFHIIYTSESEDNRHWPILKEKMLNSQILKSKVIKVKGDLDNRYIHIPVNIIKLLRQVNPDIVIAWEYNLAALQSLVWCKLRHKKFIHLTDGTLYSERNIGKVQKITRKIICKKSDACIASSTKAKEKLLAWGVKEKSIFVSLLTVDMSVYEGLVREPQPGRVLYVGSMIKRKGLDLLINALPYITEQWELHIVGNGTENEQHALQQAAENNGVVNRIIWSGFKEGENLLNEYRKASVFVLPTREDCFGLVLLEALCAEVPTVASKYADGAYDTIQNEINGFIVDPYDAEAFGKAINRAISEDKIKKGAESFSLERFTFSNVSKGYSGALNYVLNRKK